MKKLWIFAKLIFGTGLLFSCTSDIESAEDILKQLEQSANYCVYPATEQCFGGSYTTCPGIGGVVSSICPYSSSSGGNATDGNARSSSGLNASSGSEDIDLPNFDFCAFETDRNCLPGPVNECPPGGELSNACPYSSSSSVVHSSSSGVSSSGGGNECPSASGNVFIDPRDCKPYKFETSPKDGRIWMSENLNYSRNNTLGYCYGVDVDKAENPHQDAPGCDGGYGRVYEYATAIDRNLPQGLCPPGWHIPSTVEWSSIIDAYNSRIMSLGFYIYPGNYNTNSEYLPLGWKEKDKSGFYWTSSGNTYFTGFWDGPLSSYYEISSAVLESQEGASSTDKFSVRCLQD